MLGRVVWNSNSNSSVRVIVSTNSVVRVSRNVTGGIVGGVSMGIRSGRLEVLIGGFRRRKKKLLGEESNF